jgi:hypothetical protein
MRRHVVITAVVLLVSACASTPAPSSSQGSPAAAPSATAAPSPVAPSAATGVASFQDVAEGTELDPGTYLLQASDVAGGASVPELDITFTVPAGWMRVAADGVIWHDAGARIKIGLVDNLYVDPCDPSRGLRVPPVGPGVSDLATALGTVPGWSVTSADPVALSGFDGTTVELIGPDELSACTEETSRLLHALGEPDYVAALSPGEVHVVRIFDVGGTRVVIDAARRTDATPAAIAGLESISDSIDIAP